VLRHQLPVYSPLTAATIWTALWRGLTPGRDERDQLAGLLRREFAGDQALLVGSGTQALQLALRIAIARNGDAAVALPAFSCFDVATAAVSSGARLWLYDLDPGTLSPDLDSLQRALRDGARVVVLAPLYGFPVDWDAAVNVVHNAGGMVIEDAAQGLGASWRGRPLGSFGPLSVLSFGRGKGWTGGAGGALLLRPGIASINGNGRHQHSPIARELRTVAALAIQWALGRPALYGWPRALPFLRLGETVYREPGPIRPMSRAAAASVQASWSIAETESEARRRNARALLDELGTASHIRPVMPLPQGSPGFLRLPVRLAYGFAGFESPQRARRTGIAPSYPGALESLPGIRASLTGRQQCWPGAAELTRSLVTLPTHSRLGPGERDALIRMLRSYRR
jgi:dTDP-4-amino-4,6-dideoxygalactose transaminase